MDGGVLRDASLVGLHTPGWLARIRRYVDATTRALSLVLFEKHAIGF